ncbi:hypothetical protein HXX76_013694 [Chlamydomonas incerta]|uniref:Uncharacterized protein n=1 Tax=Chlamydomonas incerta TaxID=51695 RepID=A0A835VRU9_CHLIN|nr:hypothetical protein HXX76_013694 [Chlamydomonas incerta]|eukprot:KAG2425485.1 hypothetical protein HXX76_013694 [Chlamydomonas incerta]
MNRSETPNPLLDNAEDSPTPPSPSPAPAAAVATGIQWTVGKVFWTLGVFVLAGLAEIGGGWLCWQTIRNKRPWYYYVGGAAVLVAYGAIPTLQPEGASFSRVYAVYGGVFIAMSYGWGWAVDGDRPDTGDWVGAAIALAGVCLAWFWPRG